MADWKEMYLTMVRASEKALRILEKAQQDCEEMYMRDGDEEAEREEAQQEAEARADLDDYDDEEECDDGEDECEPDEASGGTCLEELPGEQTPE